MQEVGNKGPYQILIMIISLTLAFQAGIVIVGVPYYLAVPAYVGCPSSYASPGRCTQYVCSLPSSMRSKYENSQLIHLKTFANQFGNYQCHNSNIIQLVKGSSFFGAFVGYIILGLIADNWGRKLPLLVCQGIGLLGSLIILLLSVDLSITAFGIFLTGFGTQCCFGLVFSFQK